MVAPKKKGVRSYGARKAEEKERQMKKTERDVERAIASDKKKMGEEEHAKKLKQRWEDEQKRVERVNREKEEKLRREAELEAMEVEEEDDDEEPEDNKDVLCVNPSSTDMAEWRERVVDVRERDRLEEKERASPSSQVTNNDENGNDVGLNVAPSTSQGKTRESPINGESNPSPPF